jgi:hypothetical protein
MEWPEWWDWELAFTAHIESRMEERRFSEVELRTMLDDATGLAPGAKLGRWIVTTRHGQRPWTIVLEPDFDGRAIFVVTAYEQEMPR